MSVGNCKLFFPVIKYIFKFLTRGYSMSVCIIKPPASLMRKYQDQLLKIYRDEPQY